MTPAILLFRDEGLIYVISRKPIDCTVDPTEAITPGFVSSTRLLAADVTCVQ